MNKDYSKKPDTYYSLEDEMNVFSFQGANWYDGPVPLSHLCPNTRVNRKLF